MYATVFAYIANLFIGKKKNNNKKTEPIPQIYV